MKRFFVFVIGLLLLLCCTGVSFSEPSDTDTGPWSVQARQTETWTKTPLLSEKSEVFCHFFGTGKFKVYFKSVEKTATYVVDSPVDAWSSFTRLLGPGEMEVMVQSIPDQRYPNPSFTGLIATTNSSYIPDVADLQHPFFGKFRNLSNKDVKIEVVCYKPNPNEWISRPGFISGGGFILSGALKAKETSTYINFSRLLFDRTVLNFKLYEGDKDTSVDLSFFADASGQTLLKTVHFTGNDATNQSIILYPQKDGSVKSVTISELIQKNLSLLEEAIRKDPSLQRPVPKKAIISASIMDRGEDMDTFKNELSLVRKVGVNSCYKLGRMENQRASLGFTYGWASNFIPVKPDFVFDQLSAFSYVSQLNLASPSVHEKTIIMMMDEPTFFELPKTPELDARFTAWMKEKGLTPDDAGVSGWDKVKAIAPSPNSKRLSVLSREFQMSEEIKFWNGYGKIFKSVNPFLMPAINWGVSGYYDGLDIDLWEIYRQPGLDIVWGEDWHGYEPLGIGAIAWYADLMRSQAKYRSLPMGTYPILGYGYSPSLDTMRYYERLMRGCYIFDMYPYSPRGYEPGWSEKPDVLLNCVRIHRDIAQVEDILVGGKVVPAKAAILYPNSCMLWDRSAFKDAEALYLAHLHAGIPLDIITEQDLVDGYANDYKLLFFTGANIRRDALAALDTFIKNGGTVVSSSPELLDPYGEPIPQASEIFGAKSIVSLVNDSPGLFTYGLKSAKPVDMVKWNEKEIAIYCQKSRITPVPGAQTLVVFSDGSPALIKAIRGKGAVYLYGFAPGLSYMKADYDVTGSFATCLYSNRNERDIATLPAGDIDNTVKISEPMVSSRIVSSANASLVGLVDYGIGEVGRKIKNPNQHSVDFEKMEPFPVTVNISCSKKPKDVYGVRSGKLKWEYAKGIVQVQVPLRGVDLIVLEGEHLFD